MRKNLLFLATRRVGEVIEPGTVCNKVHTHRESPPVALKRNLPESKVLGKGSSEEPSRFDPEKKGWKWAKREERRTNWMFSNAQKETK